jgi:hypothetical protein
VLFSDPSQDFAFTLWCNSTLGLLCHWWIANKTQNGRGTTTITAIPHIPTLNVAVLAPEQHEAARDAFLALKDLRFLPFDQLAEDTARAELDRRLLVDVLRLDPSLCGAVSPLATLRRKLASEPQIHGNKQTRLVFTSDGECNIRD